MPNPLPYLRNTSGGLNAQVLYPFTRVVSCLTMVNKFQTAAEQRWVQRVPLFHFELGMNNLREADRASWVTFFNTQKGMLNQDLVITLGSTVYSNLTLLSDELLAVTSRPVLYDQRINLRQVANYPWTVPTVGGTYPTLTYGAGSPSVVAELPFSYGQNFKTDVSDSPYGQRYAFGWYATGLTGMPTTSLKMWRLVYPLLTDVDLATIESFFLGKQGRYKLFDFINPIDGVTYSNVRFDMDELAIRYLTVNQNSLELVLRQTNG